MKWELLVVSLVMFLAACQTPPPAPVQTATVRAATQTPPPTATQRVASTPVVIATIAPSPSATPTATPPPTASLTLSPTSTPAATATPIATPTPVARDVYVNSDDGLNLRTEPSSTGTLLRTLPPGTHLTARGLPREAGGLSWQNVQTDDGQTGWVAAQFLIDQTPASVTPTAAAPPIGETTPVVTPIAAAGYVYVIAPDGLNLRAQANAASQLLRTVADGQRLQTNGLGLGPGEDGITWLNVKTEDNVEGWVAGRFVTTTVPSLAPSVPAVNAADAVQEILNRTNALRRNNGVPPVLLNGDLSLLALEHSQYMAQNGISHTGLGGLRAGQRITLAGYGGGRPVENIYGGQATIDDAWNYWVTDPPHLDVLLNTYNTVVGIGVYKIGQMTYYTMDFGKPAE